MKRPGSGRIAWRRGTAVKIVVVVSKCDYILKDGENKQQEYKYVSEGMVLGKGNRFYEEQKRK